MLPGCTPPEGIGLVSADPEIARIDELIDQLADAPVPRLLGDRIQALVRLTTRLEALTAREVASFDRDCEYANTRMRSAGGWLARNCHLARSDAHRLVRRARQSKHMPIVTPLWQAAMIPTAAVDQLARVRKQANADERFAALEPRFARTARDGSVEQLADDLQAWTDALHAERHDPANGDGEQWDTSELHLSKVLDGIGVVNGRLDRESFAYLQRAIDAERAKQHIADDPRSPARQRADALTMICRRYLDGQTGGTNRPHLLMLCDVDTYQGDSIGLAETDRGTRVSPDMIRRVACDAILTRVLIDAAGQVLDLGRDSRTFTPHQFRALVAMYATCTFPGCTIASGDCEMHHIQHWEAGGLTNLTNGAPVCWHHHHHLHEHHWTIRREPDGSIHWHQPDGTPYGTSHPRRPAEPIPIHRPPGTRAPTPAAVPVDRPPDLIWTDTGFRVDLIGLDPAA